MQQIDPLEVLGAYRETGLEPLRGALFSPCMTKADPLGALIASGNRGRSRLDYVRLLAERLGGTEDTYPSSLEDASELLRLSNAYVQGWQDQWDDAGGWTSPRRPECADYMKGWHGSSRAESLLRREGMLPSATNVTEPPPTGQEHSSGESQPDLPAPQP